MSDSMKKTVPSSFFNFGGVALVVEPVAQAVLNPQAIGSRTGLLQDLFLALDNGIAQVPKVFRSLAFYYCACDVTEITRHGMAGEYIQNNGLVGAKWTGTPFVGITCLVATGNNRIFGQRAMAETGDFHFRSETFGGEGRAGP